MIKDLLKKQEEELDKILKNPVTWTDGDPRTKLERVSDLQKQSIRELLLAQIEMVEKMECTIKKDHPEHCHYPIALSDLQTKLKEQLKELE
jgi:hypothetical protein